MTTLSPELIGWLEQHANDLNESNQYADALFQRLIDEGIFKVGVPVAFGGVGGSAQQAVEITQKLANYSLVAGFISWGHRTVINNLLKSANPVPRERWLADLLNGKLSGGSGLSNAVKFLSGIEELQVKIVEQGDKLYLNGRLPWVSNLSANGFITVFVAEYADNSKPPVIIALPSQAEGVVRSAELELVGVQGSNTVAVELNHVELDPNWILSDNAQAYIAQIRPLFLAQQCAMAFGLAERSLAEVAKSLANRRSILETEWQVQQAKLQQLRTQLAEGLAQEGYFVENPQALFQIRIEIVDVVLQSLSLELKASGGRGYLTRGGTEFIRRWREGAFLPVVTPSVVQLKTILQSAK